ncbi:MAG: hypothetical protein ABIJ09_22960 [Pseudomonadota bacterium]
MTTSGRLTHAGGALALATLLAACPETKVQPNPIEPPAQPLTAVEICAIYESQANFSGLCVNGPLKTGASFSDAELARSCRPGTEGRVWAEDLLASLRESRVAIDWKLARQCLTSSRSLRSGNPGHSLIQSKEWNALKDGACTAFFKGITADGQACVQDWDCTDGSSCQSDTPFAPGGAVCLKPAGVDQACGDYHSCSDATYCNNGTCLLKKEDGGRCDPNLYGDDCLSASCSDAGRCDPSPEPLLDYEAPCTSDDACGGDCAKCRPAAAGGPLACRILGAAGDYCRDWLDCLDDLGCTGNVCGTVGASQRCGGTVQALCNPDLFCIPTINCAQYSGDETACVANAPICAYDSDYQECSSVEGVCTEASDLPSTGACLHGYICQLGSYCHSSGCRALALENETCAEDGVAAAYCNSGLSCVNSRCMYLCEYNEDCQPGEFCGADGLCQARAPFACADSSECPASSYCRIPGDPCAGQSPQICNKIEGCAVVDEGRCDFVSDCAAFSGDGTGCGQQVGCRYDPPSQSCAPVCYFFDGDATGCSGAGCIYDDFYGYCDPVCGQYPDDATSCAAQTTCTYSIVQVCELSQTVTGQCIPLLGTGEECASSEQCQSGDCGYDEDTDSNRCAVELAGCYRDTSFVREAFLFGTVFVFARGLRRRRR